MSNLKLSKILGKLPKLTEVKFVFSGIRQRKKSGDRDKTGKTSYLALDQAILQIYSRHNFRVKMESVGKQSSKLRRLCLRWTKFYKVVVNLTSTLLFLVAIASQGNNRKNGVWHTKWSSPKLLKH